MTKSIANIGAEKQWLMVFISNTLFEKNTNAIKENTLLSVWGCVGNYPTITHHFSSLSNQP